MALKLDKETAKALLPVRDDRQAKWHFGRTILVFLSADGLSQEKCIYSLKIAGRFSSFA